MASISTQWVVELHFSLCPSKISNASEKKIMTFHGFSPPPPCEKGGPEIFVASSPHFKQVFFLMMGGPELMGGPAFQMGDLLF